MQETSYLSSIFFKFSWGACPQTPLGSKCLWNLRSGAFSTLNKSPPFSLGFPVFQSPSTSFTEVRVGSPASPTLRNIMAQYQVPSVSGFREKDYNVENCFCHRTKKIILGGTTITSCG